MADYDVLYSIHSICIYVTDFFNILLESDKRSIEDKEVTWGDKALIILYFEAIDR